VHVLGIDIGSAFSKGIILHDKEILAAYDTMSGGDYGKTADLVRKALLSQADLSLKDITYAVATGHGSKKATYADAVRSDISCHGKGTAFFFPAVKTVIDVGDLYSKVIRIDEKGNQQKFLLSGKCAGGSGRILQVIAKVLQADIMELGPLSLKSKKRVDFNTGCAVFAESEAVSRIAEGIAREDLLAGIHRALAAQLRSLAERIGIEREIALVGGGARDVGLVSAMQEIMEAEIRVPEKPHMTAAVGAAMIAQEILAA
jgi:predicted CoA-substrate-specific enzyme activase